jgi:hypothetical protein
MGPTANAYIMGMWTNIHADRIQYTYTEGLIPYGITAVGYTPLRRIAAQHDFYDGATSGSRSTSSPMVWIASLSDGLMAPDQTHDPTSSNPNRSWPTIFY